LEIEPTLRNITPKLYTMNRKHPSAGLPVVLASAFALLLISCDNDSNGKNTGEDPLPPMSAVCKSIPDADLQNQFKSSGSDKVVASIYPVKKSGDMSQKDFDLVIILHDGKNAAAPQPADAQRFEKEAGYYVEYMKRQKVQMKDVPRSYNAMVRRQDGKGVQGMKVCVELSKMVASYDYTGYVSPGAPSFLRDSAGKCPPECPAPPQVYEQAMLRAIMKTYK
jgi:hypothetical protein